MAAGMLVKVNTVMVAGINDDHIPEVAKKVKSLGAYVVNIIPMIPVPGTKFAELKAPTAEQRKKLQDLCEPDIKQMRHCRFCRADAIGLLGEDRSAEFAHFTCQARDVPLKGPVQVQMQGDNVYKVAVASTTGKEVDLHFGQAKKFFVFQVDGCSDNGNGTDRGGQSPQRGHARECPQRKAGDAGRGRSRVAMW